MKRLNRVLETYPEWGALVGAVLLFMGLQLLRPYYFLTDDNMTGYMPVMNQVLERVRAGDDFLSNPYLFGGWRLTSDAGFVGIFNPWVWLMLWGSPSGRTVGLADWTALGSLLVGSWCFVQMARTMSRNYGLQAGPIAWIFWP